jgi:adenine specific DNA methylase Mod
LTNICTIAGEVVLDLKKATKTNNIKVALEGNVDIGGRNISLFTKSVIIAKSPDGDKSYYLEPFTHRFPFLITIPTEKEYSLPSTLEVAHTDVIYPKINFVDRFQNY